MSSTRMLVSNGKNEIDDSARSLVFGKLIEIAQPVILFSQSDLYRDVQWIQEYVTGDDATFFFGVRENGTSIGTTLRSVTGNAVRFEIRVYVEDGSTYMDARDY